MMNKLPKTLDEETIRNLLVFVKKQMHHYNYNNNSDFSCEFCDTSLLSDKLNLYHSKYCAGKELVSKLSNLLK